MMILSQYHIFELDTISIYSVGWDTMLPTLFKIIWREVAFDYEYHREFAAKIAKALTVV
jgi:hypothetical protein